MNLTFRHSGLQFFFITLTLEGRPPMLSRLIEGEARGLLPPLIAIGLAVGVFFLARTFYLLLTGDEAVAYFS